MTKLSSNFWELEDLANLVEDTFDTCSSSREEIIWTICLLRGLMNVPNKRKENHPNNYHINLWQYQLHPIIEKYKKRWKHSNYA